MHERRQKACAPKLQQNRLKKQLEKARREMEELEGIKAIIDDTKKQAEFLAKQKKPRSSKNEKPFDNGELQAASQKERIEGRQSLLPGTKLSKKAEKIQMLNYKK